MNLARPEGSAPLKILVPSLHRLSTIARAAGGSAGSIALRGSSIVSNIAAVGLAIRLLGPERYGQYVLLIAAAAWLGLAMLGTGENYTKSLVKVRAGARDPQARPLAQATLLYSTMGAAGATLISIAGLTGLMVLALADRTIFIAGMILLVGTSVSSPLVMASSALVAEGRITFDALFKLLQPLSLLAMVGVAYLLPPIAPGTMLIILAAAHALSVAGTRVAAFLATFQVKPLLRNLLSTPIGPVARATWPFLIIQLAAMLSFQTDRFLVSSFSSFSELASYDLLFRIFSAVYMVFSIPLLHIWRLVGTSWHDADMLRLKRVMGLYFGGGALFWIAVTLAAVLLAPLVIEVFSGDTVTALAWPVTALIGAFFLVRGTTDVLTLSLYAMEQERKVLPFVIAHGVTNVAFAAAGGALGGVAGLLIGQIVSFVLSTQLPFLFLISRQLRRGLAA